MKKFLALVAALLFASTSQASITVLVPPANVAPFRVHYNVTHVTGFNADGSISGNCRYVGYAPVLSGRGGGYRQPPTLLQTCLWDVMGVPISASAWDGAPDVTGPVIEVSDPAVWPWPFLIYAVATNPTGQTIGWEQRLSYLVTP